MLKKRIPTIIGLLLLAVGAFIGVVFVNQSTDFLPRASPEYIPQKIKVTNISDSGFVVSWVTQEPTIGFVKYGQKPGNLDITVVDERDQLTGDSGEYRTHYIPVLGLVPETTYYFKLGTHGKRLYDDNGQELSVTTGPTLGTPPPADAAYGVVMTPAQTPAEGALVYISFPEEIQATPLSALVKQNGNWAIGLSTARSKDLASFARYDPQNTTLNLLVYSTIQDDAVAITTTAITKPVPPITLGQTHNFTSEVPPPDTSLVTLQPEALSPTPPPSSKFSLMPIVVTEPVTEKTLTIVVPAKQESVINDPQPNLGGTAPPGTTLTITLHSSQIYTDTVYADETGAWQWKPPGYLEPGEHAVTISYTDQQGILHTLSRSFTVAASSPPGGTLVNYSATPSATPKINPSSTPKPLTTVTPPLYPTTQPTVTVKPTPTASPTVRPSTAPTPTPPTALPDAGTGTPTLVLGLFGLICLAGGVWFTRRLAV
jgi:hypothetical protein